MSAETTLNVCANIASILALSLTVWILYEARKIRQYYRRHLILPKFNAEVVAQCRNLKKAIQDKQIASLKTCLHKCEAVIERMPAFSDKPLRVRAIQVRHTIRALVQEEEDDLFSHASDVQAQIEGLIQATTSFMSDSQWTRTT